MSRRLRLRNIPDITSTERGQMNKNSKNDPIQSVDGKKVREGMLVDAEDLQRRLVVQAARTAHEANRVYCQSCGDNSQLPWDQAPEWQQVSAISGVIGVLQNPDMSPEQGHSMWMAQKKVDGWVPGPVKDAEKKVHPCLLPYEDLPAHQKFKDRLFAAVVKACLNMPVMGDDDVKDAEFGAVKDCVAERCPEPDGGCECCDEGANV